MIDLSVAIAKDTRSQIALLNRSECIVLARSIDFYLSLFFLLFSQLLGAVNGIRTRVTRV